MRQQSLTTMSVSDPLNELESYNCSPFSLLIGVICGDLVQIRPLFKDIEKLRLLQYLIHIEVYVLANGESGSDITKVLESIFTESNSLSFNVLEHDQTELLPIGSARSKLQKLLGSKMEGCADTYAWILDDDMRIPNEANKYLTWLPRFKEEGIDVLIGNFSGASPNPPAHGIRCQLNDLIHNLDWLNTLADESELPNRSAENEVFRAEYPDYYYDLSRKHKRHLEEPYWIIPEYTGEIVSDARHRVISNVEQILTGEPFLRPLVTAVSTTPLKASRPSCNRGGNTFVLNAKALTSTPNAVLLANGEENRRSDMIWAIINRYYHQLTVHAVSFPVLHHRYIGVSKELNLDKTISEIRGSAIYAAMYAFFQKSNRPSWDNLVQSGKEISGLYYDYIEARLKLYKENFHSISLQLKLIESDYMDEKFYSMISILKEWVSEDNLKKIENEVGRSNSFINVEDFINSLDEQIKSFKK
jgi:hypothetical protein